MLLGRPGLAYPPPLTAEQQQGKRIYESLCNKCHDVDGNILQNRSFPEHSRHVSGERAACGTCHDAHGISGGNVTNNWRLINFDTAIVGPSSSGVLRFESTGASHGRCYLTCHGQNHNPETY